MIRIIFWSAILLPLFAQSQLSCLDADGNPVDWFAALKYPETVKGGFGYIDSTTSEDEFVILSGHVDDNGGALANTIQGINAADVSLLVYNDEFPNSTTIFTGAHAKGFIAWDGSSRAVYIMHSAPKYPNVSSSGKITPGLNKNAYMYGQNFFCVNLEISDLDSIQQNLQTIQPAVYYSSGAFESLDLSTPFSATQTINSFKISNGDTITLLSKAPSFNQFLYEGIIEPYYNTSLLVESWGRPYSNPNCTEYESTNVDEVKLSSGASWASSNDHSKWAVSFDDAANVACAADMNRMNSQIKRGGSAFCYQNDKFYNAFKNVVAEYSNCNGQPNGTEPTQGSEASEGAEEYEYEMTEVFEEEVQEVEISEEFEVSLEEEGEEALEFELGLEDEEFEEEGTVIFEEEREAVMEYDEEEREEEEEGEAEEEEEEAEEFSVNEEAEEAVEQEGVEDAEEIGNIFDLFLW